MKGGLTVAMSESQAEQPTGIGVHAFQVVTYTELAPLLDALGDVAPTVRSQRHSFDAPMAQPTAALSLPLQ